jgi:two-component system sensor histidine kinase/response regulator
MPGTYVPTLVGLSLTIALLAALAIGLIDRQLRLKTRLLEAEVARPQAERLRAFYDALTCGVMVRAPRGVLTYANRAALRLQPFATEEIASGVRHPGSQLRGENGEPLEEAQYPSAIARRTKQPVTGMLVSTRAGDGTETWLLCDAVPSIDATTGEVGDVIISLVDVTERRRMERALRESEERFRTMVDSLADGIVLQLADFSIATCNASAERITGLTADQMLDRAPRPDGWLAIREDGSRFDLRQHPSIVALLSGQPASCMMGVQSAGRGTTWISVNTRPLFHAGARRPYAALSSIIDVTDRVHAQDAEREARQAAEATSRAKSDFLANMSHEIRTPMNGVLGMLELALGSKLEPTQREYLEVAQRSAESLLEVINEILDFSKVEAGRLELRPEPFALADCLGAAIDPLGPRAARKGIELAMRIAPNMPPILVGDAVRLGQVITNLAGNAVKFTEHGEIVITAELESANAEEQEVVVHFAVRDTGIGIPADKQSLIFEAFTQADASATRAYMGTGLGLAIATRLVALMGGRLWVESVDGQGSTFHFTARFATRASSAPLEVENGTLDTIRDMSVLVVDDNGTNRLILHEMLASWEMRPTMVPSARAALAAMESADAAGTPYGLLLVDGYMPEMDGFALVETLRQNPRFAGATVLMLTSADGDGGADRCRALGIAAHLLKPIKSRDLRAAIVRALGTAPDDRAAEPVDVLDARSAHPSRILLAEDNLVNQKLAVAVLERWGHTVEVADNGRAALTAVARERFAAVLMDVQMPTMDGLRATMEIRAGEAHTGEHIPIIAMTARTMSGDREKCLEAGMDAYVSKPFELEELFAVLEPILARRAGTPPSLGVTRGRGRKPRPDDAPAATVPSRDVIDATALMGAVGGDRRLLSELVGLFEIEGPRRLQELHRALAANDAAGVEAAAHGLKGNAASLHAKRSFDAASAVELLARTNALHHAPAACAALEHEIAQLQRALAPFAGAA